MKQTIALSKADARRAMVRHHFAPSTTQMEAFQRLRSIQFDPIAPVGCNHDLVLQARVPGYKVGDWQKTAYQDRKIYDGWDKQASLIPVEGWPWRRIFHKWHRAQFGRIFDEHPHAVDAILKELQARGPLMPKDCDFQQRKEEWKGSWHGPNLAKQTLRALWHSGLIMTTGRRNGHHVYDLTERVLPAHLYHHPPISDEDALRELVWERHLAVGLLRPTASWEVWSYSGNVAAKNRAIQELVETGKLIPVNVDGTKAHATTEFLALLDLTSLEPRTVFVGPLDPFIWDRKMVRHLFEFEYIWEIYTPEAKRRWGYYVLPVLYGDSLVARVEFWSRKGVLEIRRWHTQAAPPPNSFQDAFEKSLKAFMAYVSADQLQLAPALAASVPTLKAVSLSSG
jgi:uncharacterized protein